MTSPSLRIAVAALAAALAAALPARAEPGHVFAPLSAADIAGIAAAVPARARAVPAHPRAILVFYRTEGYVHDSIPFINEAIRRMGERTGAYRADLSDDMAVFTPHGLAPYDAVVFQNTTRLEFKDPAARRALLDYIRSGRGFVGIHAASDNFYSWPEAQDMLGGVFHDHPWISLDTEAVKIDDPASPLTAAFGGKGFWIREEIYQIAGPYNRDRQRVLLSLDMSKPENFRSHDQLFRTDFDFPIAWVKPYGRGRVFYTSIGHNRSVTDVPEILQFYLDGIQFAIGDLRAPSSPLPPSLAPALASAPGLALQDRGYRAALAPGWQDRLAAYDFSPDRVPLVAIDLYLRAQGPKAYPLVERGLLEVLARPGLPVGARDYIVRTLAMIGSRASVPALQALTDDPKCGTLAITALFAIPGEDSAKALAASLLSAHGRNRVTVIGAVGRRRLAAAIPQLAALARSGDSPTAAAAINALGDIGTPGSLQALRSLPAGYRRSDVGWAELASPRASEDLIRACREILDSDGPDSLRVAALRRLAQSGGADFRPLLWDQLFNSRPALRFAAANLLARSGDLPALRGGHPPLAQLDPRIQAVLLDAFDADATPGAFAWYREGLESPIAAVRIAAIGGLGDAPESAAVPLLIARLSGNSDEAREAAASLGRQRSGETSAALIAAVAGAAPAAKASLLSILAARVDRAAYASALAAVGDEGPAVRRAAFDVVAATSRAADLSTVLSLLRRSRTAAERRSMERALLEIVRSSSHPAAVVEAIDRTLASTRGPARYSLLVAIALAGTDNSRAILARQLADPSPDRRREALRAIAGAQNPRLAPLLLSGARHPADPDERTLALRDYLDLLEVPNGRSEAETNGDYAQAWPLAGAAQQDAILASLRLLKTDSADAEAAHLEAGRAPR